MSSSSGLSLADLAVDYARVPVLRGISLEVPPGTILALLGPNGSGKTTLLRAIAGLEATVGGHVRLDGRVLDGVPTHRRGLGFLFQEPALFPGRTVAENIAYGLDVARWPRGEADARIAFLLGRLGIAALAGRPAEALSGGERQRVALARTLAPRPRLVLLDEPFAAVDPEFRAGLRAEFRTMLREEGVAALHVTHDPEEALAVGDALAMLRAGRLVQHGPSEEVFRSPVDPEAARFLGYQIAERDGATVAVHPREVGLGDGPGAWPAEVVEVRPALGERVIRLRLEGGAFLEVRHGDLSGAAPSAGDRVSVRPLRPLRYRRAG